MHLKDNLFFQKISTINGRFSRSEFWTYGVFFPFFIFLIIFLLSGLFAIPLGDGNIFSKVIATIGVPIFFIATIYLTIISYIKRLHDLGNIGWYALILLIPFINIFLFIYCGFVKGIEGENKYGKDPLSNNN